VSLADEEADAMTDTARKAVEQLELIEAALFAIKNSELDCCAWSENSQKMLAFEIGAAIEVVMNARALERKLYQTTP